MRLTDRDRELLDALNMRVRLFSLSQIARIWWAESKHPEQAAARRMLLLARHGWVRRLRVLTRPLPMIRMPMASWSPGQQDPRFGELSYRLKRRWAAAPRMTTVIVGGANATRVFAAKPALKHEQQATHDLGVTEMYLLMRQQRADDAANWIGEDRLPRRNNQQVRPDAVIAPEPDASPQLLLEFGGAYDVLRLCRFHDFAKKQNTPYEIW